MDPQEPAVDGLDAATVALARAVVAQWRDDLKRLWARQSDEDAPSSQRAFGEAVSTILALGRCARDSDSPAHVCSLYRGLTSVGLRQLAEEHPRRWVLTLWLLRLRAAHAVLRREAGGAALRHRPMPAEWRAADASFLRHWYAAVNAGLQH
ncbi:MAG: hypothetical protein BRC31_00590 [Actinobacteria bacterium QS_5_72_10]|nr:MAG: hypothetical protein BRC31_00590 [Actinobacteria bacterium QS_5_72_10]